MSYWIFEILCASVWRGQILVCFLGWLVGPVPGALNASAPGVVRLATFSQLRRPNAIKNGGVWSICDFRPRNCFKVNLNPSFLEHFWLPGRESEICLKVIENINLEAFVAPEPEPKSPNSQKTIALEYFRLPGQEICPKLSKLFIMEQF